MSRILILEGPSGAGKTTLANRLGVHDHELITSDFPRPRDYDYSQPETLMPICRDLWHMFEASFFEKGPDARLLIDRWMFSSFVYHVIRQDEALAKTSSDLVISAEWFMVDWLLSFDALVRTASSLKYFDNKTRYNQRSLLHCSKCIYPELVFVLLLPPVDELLRRREVRGHEYYPYSAYDEHRLYRIIAEAFRASPWIRGHQNLRLEVLTETKRGYYDIDHLL